MNNIILTNDEKDLLEKMLCLGHLVIEEFGEDYCRYEDDMKSVMYHLCSKLQSAFELSDNIW